MSTRRPRHPRSRGEVGGTLRGAGYYVWPQQDCSVYVDCMYVLRMLNVCVCVGGGSY